MSATRCWVLTLAVAAFASGARPVQGQVALPLGPEVVSVAFVGNRTFPGDSLEQAILTSETRCSVVVLLRPLCWFGVALRRGELREIEVARDAARLEIWYQRRGFREVDASGTFEVDSAGRARVVFTVSEGEPVFADRIVYTGADAFLGAGLLDALPASPGDRWSSLRLDATRDTLVRRLNDRGHPYADVLRQTVFPAAEPYHAHVTFEVEAGTAARYGEIQVVGLDRLSESTILRTLPFRSGDPYRVGQVIDAQGRLFGLDLVSSASITPDLSSPTDSTVDLVVQVQEGDPYRVRAGAGWSRSECFTAESRWTSRNFFGGGRVLQVRGRLANILASRQNDQWLCRQVGEDEFVDLTWLGAVDFSQPWIFSTRNRFNASLVGERQSVPDVFIRRSLGLQLALIRAVGPQTPLTLSYRPELSSLDAAETLLCSGFLVCTEEDIGVLTRAQRIAPVGLNLTRDLSNSLLNPTRGYRLIVDLEHAASWTGSEFRYDRALIEGTWYSRLLGPAVLATRVRGGWVGSGGEAGTTDIIPPQKRYCSGGANSVRGFGQSRLGPRVLLAETSALIAKPRPDLYPSCTLGEIANLTCDGTGARFDSRPTGGTRVIEGNAEVRVPLVAELEAVTFVDFGQVWSRAQTLSLAALEFTPGLGLRYLSPVGPLRVDLGYNFQADERLQVVTNGLVADASTATGYRATDDLVILDSPVSFRSSESRFQLHISIGQAF